MLAHRPVLLALLATLAACDDGADVPRPDSAPLDAAPADAAPADAAPADAVAADAAPPDAADAASPDAAPPPPGRALLNEVDCRGRDFVEVVNPGPLPVDLTGWSITDDPDDPDRAHPLAGNLAPGALLAARRQTADEDGFTFGVGCGDDVITLLDPAGHPADAVAVPNEPAAFTWGRLPDATGDWQRTWPSRAAPNRPPDDPAAPLFDPAHVFRLDLRLAPADRERLAAAPSTEVPATLAFAGGPPQPVHLRVKGRAGSFRSLDEKPAFKVDLDDLDPDGHLLGLRRLTLNNMVQDPSYVHEWLAYTLFRAAGVPAPRVGYAWVTLDGEPLGLYAHVETPDDRMLGRWFPETAHLYEGAYGQDLYPEVVPDFEVDEGDAGDRDDLATLAALLNATPPEQAYAATADRVDWPQVLTTLVIETYIGHWDGYGPTRNNYFLHFDDAGVLRLLPWGTDQTFDAPLPLRVGQGRLLRRCNAAPACRAAYDETLARVLAVVDALDLPRALDAQVAALTPWINRSQRHPFPVEWARPTQRAAREFLVDRRARIGAELDCLRGPDPDPDGDGWACGSDCDPDDPATFPGAEDLCGDGLDQDCSGEPDDTPDCLVCVPVERDARRYQVCPSRRSWPEARATCATLGMDLAVADDADELAWLVEATRAVRDQGYWLGATDAEVEGEVRWLDGRPVDRGWLEGEPNDAEGGEDCVELISEPGGLNDLPCWAGVGFVCEE